MGAPKYPGHRLPRPGAPKGLGRDGYVLGDTGRISWVNPPVLCSNSIQEGRAPSTVNGGGNGRAGNNGDLRGGAGGVSRPASPLARLGQSPAVVAVARQG